MWEAYCRFSFEVTVPEAAFYVVEVAGYESPVWSGDDPEAAGWEVELSSEG